MNKNGNRTRKWETITQYKQGLGPYIEGSNYPIQARLGSSSKTEIWALMSPIKDSISLAHFLQEPQY